jgi:predicted esterase YcpF (UPF0227 family)
MQHLVYLHGFLSSPKSEKAQQTLAYAKRQFPALNIYIPQLPGDINAAVRKIEVLMASLPANGARIGFIGSSMGGFLATYILEKYADTFNAKAVLVNPAVTPYELLADYIGEHQNPYTQERFTISSNSIKSLRTYSRNAISNAYRYQVMLQTEDETLDYRLAVAKYAGANMIIEPGGNHSFEGYTQHLRQIFTFLRQ